MNCIRYFKCKNCKTLIRFPNWNKEKERQINDLKCPQCNSSKLEILRKRPYHRLKLETYLSLCVKHNGEYIVISK